LETFGQYAATRPLREHPLAATTSSGGVLVQDSMIRTFIGVDLITGMPVIVYTMPGPAPRLPEVYSEHLPAMLERGQRDGTGYLIFASAPGYAPLKPTLPEPRLHWLARSSARALMDAHAVGLIHRHLRPEHFYAQGDHLFIEGFGLPWSDKSLDAPDVYRAPEGPGQAPADVYAWARCMNTFASNNPETAQDGELGHLIGHCLNLKARERPTAGELVMALEQILSPKAASEVAPAAVPIGRETPLRRPAPESAVPEPASQAELIVEPTFATAPLTESVVVTSTLPTPTLESALKPVGAHFETPNPESGPEDTPQEAATHTLPVPAGLEADEPDVVAPDTRKLTDHNLASVTVIPSSVTVIPSSVPDSTPRWPDDDVHSTRVDDSSKDIPSAIRIGWQDDDSWRAVRAPTPVESGRPPVLVWLLGALLVVGLLAGLVWFLRSATAGTPTDAPNPPIMTDRYVVNFRLDPSSGPGGQLTVVEAPVDSGYAVGQVLSSVPGPVLFTKPGTYRVRVSVKGYESAETTIEIPGSDTVILKLSER
jgi:hypothetical protein